MKTTIIVSISLILVFLFGLYLYNKAKVDQKRAENERLALIYGGLEATKVSTPVKDFFNSILGTTFGGASNVLGTEGGKNLALLLR